MKKIIFIILAFITQIQQSFAGVLWWNKNYNSAIVHKEKTEQASSWLFDGFSEKLSNFWNYFLYAIWIAILLYSIFKLIRLLFELWYWKGNIRYLKVTLPRADSKLDKEKETKKDFKEKVAQMSMFYKAIHKLSEAWAWDTILNFFFWHSKVSLELVYDKWEVTFFIATYARYVNLVSQHLTSVYNDAEIVVVDPKKDYVDLKEKWYHLRAASLWKEKDDVFPIKTYKYLEDDALNNFTNVFWGLNKDDKAVFQVVIKPLWSSWNKKAKKAAWLVAKWKYKKWKKSVFLMIFRPLTPLYNIVRVMFEWSDAAVKDQQNAPWASEGDAYKIFNQAETEAQKLMWEAAAQPAFETSIRILVSSKDKQKTEDWIHAIVAAASIFTDEYNNALDNPQIIEDTFPWIIWKIRYFAFKYKLIWILQDISIFSVDEITTVYHLPDVNYNKSPIIKWLGYKKLPPPHNLKYPTQIQHILKREIQKLEKLKKFIWNFEDFLYIKIE